MNRAFSANDISVNMFPGALPQATDENRAFGAKHKQRSLGQGSVTTDLQTRVNL